jgi:hypothetical protein
MTVVGGAAMAQDNRIVVQVVDGRNGKPLANQHLLVFAGESPEGVRLQKEHFQLVTDNDGLADLPIASGTVQWIQVWPDWHILCQKTPNREAFSVTEILSTGLSTPNACGSVRQELRPGHFVVFARPAHFWEKMHQ